MLGFPSLMKHIGKISRRLEDLGVWYTDARIGMVVPQYVDIDTIEEMEAKKINLAAGSLVLIQVPVL